jgi:hypothetical protein
MRSPVNSPVSIAAVITFQVPDFHSNHSDIGFRSRFFTSHRHHKAKATVRSVFAHLNSDAGSNAGFTLISPQPTVLYAEI